MFVDVNVECKSLLTSLQAAEGNSLYEEDEELTCNLCQRRFEEQGTCTPDKRSVRCRGISHIFRLCVSKCVIVLYDQMFGVM